MATADRVQEVYVAYYGRPADSEGLAFWVSQLDMAGGDLGAIIEAFGESDEFNERFGNDDTETLINNIYQNLFGRDADAEGLAFYADLLDSGEASLADISLRILDGAQNDDALDVAAKVAAANLFTAAAGPEYAGSDAANAANAWLATINRDSDLVEIENNIADIVRDVLPEVPGLSGNLFTLTELPSQTEYQLMWGEVPAEVAFAFLQEVAGLDLVKLVFGEGSGASAGDLDGVIESITISDTSGGSTININTADGGLISAGAIAEITKLALLAGIILPVYTDSQSVVTQTGIVLTPNENNGGSFESGFTTNNDDTIVAGRPELLHGAYIDGGGGYDTLVVDMKGFYAQPFQLLNIQEVQVQNLSNVYSVDQTINFDADAWDFPIPSPGVVSGTSSNLDLSRAIHLEKLVVTEGLNDGTLNIAGIQNYATARLEGSFSQAVNLFYGRGQGDQLTVELANVSFNNTFSVNQNVGAVHLVSEGRVNTLDNVDFGGNFVELTVSGTGLLSIESDLQFGFGEAYIDASANTGGVRLNLDSQDGFDALQEITIIGSQARDVFTIDSAASQGVLLNIDTGAGRDTIVLNAPVAAGEGSVLTGENLTVQVNANADMREADVSGVDNFVISAQGGLLLMQDQAEELGAGAFSAAFNSIPVLSIQVDQAGTVLSDLLDLSALDSDVKLAFNVQAGASLDLTAEELHAYLAANGVVGQGVVNVSEAGLSFNPLDTGVAIGDGFGTVSANFVNTGTLNITRSDDGFERPVADPSSDIWTITADGDTSVGAQFDGDIISATGVNTLVIDGEGDVTFTKPVELGDNFNVDFSELDGNLDGLTIFNFHNITEAADSDDWGQMIGNNSGTRIDVWLDGDVAELDAGGGLRSQGIEQYVVVNMGGNDRSFHVSDSTQDVELLGLKGNQGNILTFTNLPFGLVNPEILLEGDGFADFSELSKAAGDPNASNIGTVVADWFRDGEASGVFNVNNAGVTLGVTSTGGERALHVDGIETNAGDVTINVADGNAIIGNLTADDASSITVNSNPSDVQLWMGAIGDDLETIDMSGVDGAGVFGVGTFDVGGADFSFSGFSGVAMDLSGVELIGVDAIALAKDAVLTLNIDQLLEIPLVAAFNADDDEATVNVGNLSDEEFSIDALSIPDGIDFGTVTIAAEAEVTLNELTDLTGVVKVIVPAGTTLNLTAEQYNQIEGDAGVKIEVQGAGDAAGKVNITDLRQADVAANDADADGNLDLTAIVAADAGTDDAVVQGTITLADPSVTLFMNDVLAGFAIDLGEDQEIRLANAAQASGRVIEGDEGARVVYRSDDPGSFLFNGLLVNGLDVRGYSDLDQLEVLSTLLAGNNVEEVLFGLASAIEVFVVAPEEMPDAIVDTTNRKVVVDEGVTIGEVAGTSLIFEDLTPTAEVETLELFLQGDVTIQGTVNIQALLGVVAAGAGFQTLTINSLGDDPNTMDNIAATDNNLLDIVINAEQDLSAQVVTLSTAGVDPATATITLTGDADVTVKEVVADANVTSIVYDTTDYTGSFVQTGGSASLSGAVETLTFEGTGDVVIGTPDVADPDDVESWGVNALDLSTVNAADHEGALTIVFGNVDGDSFSFTGGTGVNTIWLSGIGEAPALSPTLNAPGEWSFDLSEAAAGSALRITDEVTFGAGDLTLNLGVAQLQIAGNVDFRALDSLVFEGADPVIFLEEGATVQMTDEQFAAFEAAGGTIEGPGTTLLVDADLAIDFDLTDVRGLTELQLVTRDDEAGEARQVADEVTLTFEQAELTTQYYYDADGDFAVLPVDGDGLYDPDGDPAEAGDFRGFAQPVTVAVSSDADLRDLQLKVVTDAIQVQKLETLPELAITEEQLSNLEVVTDTDTDPVTVSSAAVDLAAGIGELAISVSVRVGDDAEGVEIIQTRDIVITNDGETITAEAHALALAAAQNGAQATELNGLLDETESAQVNFVGTTPFLEQGEELDARGDASAFTFSFVVGTVDNADSLGEFTSIINFQAGDGGVDEDPFDILDFAAFFTATAFDASFTVGDEAVDGTIHYFESAADVTLGNINDSHIFDGLALFVVQNGADADANVWALVGNDEGAGTDADLIQIVGLTDVDGQLVEANFA